MKKITLAVLSFALCIMTMLFVSCNEPDECQSHSWDDGRATKTATCSAEGEMTYTCTVCGRTEVKKTEKAAHAWGTPTETKAPTCSAEGEATATCSVCGITDKIILEKSEHSYTESIITAATCNDDGLKKKTCSVCQTSEEEAIPATGNHRWGVPVKTKEATCSEDGIRTRTCLDCKVATDVQSIPATGNHVFTSGENTVMIKLAPTETQNGIKVNLCRNCVAEKETVYTYAEYQEDLKKAMSALASVDVSAFGTKDYSKMSTTRYEKPAAYPTVGQHPRLLFNTNDIETLRAAMGTNANIDTVQDIIKVANAYDSGLLGEIQTYASSGGYGPKGTHNLNESILRTLMAKAFLYQITGTQIYAYDCIRIMKEYMATMKIVEASPDPERNWGYTMFTAAIVYDWCYDVLTEQDKIDLIRGVEFVVCAGNNMEIGFPPTGQGVFSGHGAERQLLRDYLSFALAIYDEEPTWYELIGGRFYEQYVPARNSYYEAHMVPQGISTYIQIRYSSDLWSAWLMKSAVGEIPYNTEDMKEIMTSIFCRVVGGGEYLFQEGDDELRTSMETLQAEAFSALISAYLFNDTVSASWAKYLDYAHTDSPLLLILRSTGVDESLDRFEQLPLIRYMGGFRSELIVHTSHDANAVSVTMKIGEKSSGGHDHADSGSFQIYYNALLAGDSGVYDTFNSTHHKNYHRATIAHNSIIVYRDGVALGQRTVGEPNMQQWTDGTCETGTTTGVSYGYADAEMTIPVYGYLAGDISAAYSGNLEKADRRMLAVFDTDNPEIPMYFFVYDNITSYDANDRKAFLLHVKTAPIIEGKTVTVNCGAGRLVLQNVHGASTIEGIGGNDNNFVVNGYQVPTSDGSTDGYWGRLEISPSIGSLNNSMLNVMYVTKTSSKASATATRIKNNYVVGSIIGNTAAVFVESAEKIDEQFYFTATGTGELNYYVSGVAAGTWNVRAGSTNVNIVVSEESGLLTFTAPAGMVTITPVN